MFNGELEEPLLALEEALDKGAALLVKGRLHFGNVVPWIESRTGDTVQCQLKEEDYEFLLEALHKGDRLEAAALMRRLAAK